MAVNSELIQQIKSIVTTTLFICFLAKFYEIAEIQFYLTNQECRYRNTSKTLTENSKLATPPNPSLEETLEHLIEEVNTTNEPAVQKFRKPNYVLMENNIPLGYIEAKDVGEKYLEEKKQNKNQFDHYKSVLNNLILRVVLLFIYTVMATSVKIQLKVAIS